MVEGLALRLIVPRHALRHLARVRLAQGLERVSDRLLRRVPDADIPRVLSAVGHEAPVALVDCDVDV